jgi:hypothetical protein
MLSEKNAMMTLPYMIDGEKVFASKLTDFYPHNELVNFKIV